MRALIGSGWTDIQMAACDLPDNLAVVEQADHAWLFPQCAAIVHHGGAGTTHAGLSAGVPNVVCSFFADQPLWGGRVSKLGVGTHMRFRDISYARLKACLEGALREEVAAKASQLGAALAAENGVETACEALEKALR
jgi:sterol 3beta-glucosyltransferase